MLAFMAIPDFKLYQFSPIVGNDRGTEKVYVTAEEKLKVAKQLAKFILDGFPKDKWTTKLYEHVSNMWGHIAHYDIWGFYDAWFSNAQNRMYFLKIAFGKPPVGDPKYTRSDIEKAIRDWLNANPKIATHYIQEAANDTQSKELLMLKALVQKYPNETRKMLA